MSEQVKLLIIDDEDIVLSSCQRIFRDENSYMINTARSGQEGLDATKQKDFDIVITDLMMPGIGGMEVLKTLRAEKPELTVIIFTGYATVESVREALKLGAFDYIPKPFTPDELRHVVRNAVEAHRHRSDAKMLDLLAIVSHELKSPISVMHTTADTLYKGYFGNLDPQQQKTVEAILRNCQYLEDIIRNYLDLSKMELDNLESFKEEIRLVEDVIQPVLDIPENTSNLKNITVDASFDVRPAVHGDPNLLKIVVTNLVNNAIKYGKADTVVRLRLAEKNDAYLFSVFNEGVGMSPEDIRDKLFKKWSRLKQKGTEGIKGSGLGLYMCKKIVEKHLGTIWAESEQGKSVTFFISLPKR